MTRGVECGTRFSPSLGPTRPEQAVPFADLERLGRVDEDTALHLGGRIP
ncbi:hypothetical protein AB0O86_28170 [Streptomyces hirsutus]